MSPADYTFLCEFLEKRSGLVLNDGKQYLVEARLLPLAQSSNLKDISELVRDLRSGRNAVLATSVIEEMTTNKARSSDLVSGSIDWARGLLHRHDVVGSHT